MNISASVLSPPAEPSPLEQLPETRSIAMMVMTVLILAYSFHIGMVAILALYGIWFSHIYFKKRFVLKPSRDIIVPFAFSLLCALSFIWSDYPMESLYKGTEFITMMIITLIIARLVPSGAFIKGIALSCTLVMAITLSGGTYGGDAFSSDRSLVGFFGSKNMVGFFAEIGMFSILISFFLHGQRILKILAYIPAFLLCATCLYLSKSSSSLISIILILSGMGFVTLTRTLKTGHKKILLVLGLLATITAGCFLMAAHVNFYDDFLHALGKDSTLTGRTYLWQEGIRIGQKDPVIGHGYSAFWVQGQPEAEKYWKEFYIPNKSGFHFHNMLIQTFVDLGGLGVAFIVWMTLKNFILSFYRSFLGRITPHHLMTLCISTLFLIRMMVEVDYLGPFSMGCLLFFYASFTTPEPPSTPPNNAIR